ncbi:MAG: hypothetical protein IJV27_03315 [Prevotella sp.]|nr:hypothetical protein [Prevotella sp.]
MKNSKINSKEVEVQYTFVNNDGFYKENAIVYPFDKETITSVVNTKITCANYRLGQVRDGKFDVFYAGRVTGEPLRQRLQEHLVEYGDYTDAFFQFIVQDTEESAYQQECKDFHTYQDIDEEKDKGYFKNKYHPARPTNSSITCKICGK